MALADHLKGIEDFVDDGTDECLEQLKGHLLAVGPDYLLQQEPDDNVIYDACLNQETAESKIRLLQAVVVAGWPIFDPQYNFAFELAYCSKWLHQPETVRLYEYFLGMGLDPNATNRDLEDESMSITDAVCFEMVSELCCEGGPLKEIQYLAAAWNVLKSAQKGFPYRGIECFEGVIGRRLTAVYAKYCSEDTTEIQKYGGYWWSEAFIDEVVFDFEGKYLVYNGDAFVNPHVLTQEIKPWVNVSVPFVQFLDKTLLDIDFEELDDSDGCLIAVILKFEGNESLTGVWHQNHVLLEPQSFEVIMPKLKGIEHQPRCKSWDEVRALEPMEVEEDDEAEEVEEVEDVK